MEVKIFYVVDIPFLIQESAYMPQMPMPVSASSNLLFSSPLP